MGWKINLRTFLELEQKEREMKNRKVESNQKLKKNRPKGIPERTKKNGGEESNKEITQEISHN